MTLDYYNAPLSGPRIAAFTLRDERGKVLSEVVATFRTETQTLQPYSGTGRIPYPMYEILTAVGVTEVIEHRRMEPIFYITDDPQVRRALHVDP